MNGNDTSDLSMSSKNKFDLNQFLVYSLNPLSDDNQKFEIGPATAQEKNDTSIIYLSRPNNSGSNRSTYSTQAPEVTNSLDTKSVNTNLYHPSLNFPSKDIDQLSYTTTSSLSQARSNSVSTAITTLTTASSCKSHISPSIAETVNVDVNQFPHNHQLEQIATFQEQTTVCWSSDKIHFLDPLLIQDIDNITTNSLTHQEKINAIGADYSHRFIAFASSPPPPQQQLQLQLQPPPPPPPVPQLQDQDEIQLNTDTKQSSDTLTQEDFDFNKLELLNNQTMEIAIEYQTSAHHLIEYASSSSNVLLGYLEIDVDVDVDFAVPENERSSLQPAFDYKKGCPLSRDSDSTCDELESLESSSNFIYVEECNSLNPPEVSSSPTKKYILQSNIPSSPIVAGRRTNILENQFLETKDNYGNSQDPTIGTEIKLINDYNPIEASKEPLFSPMVPFLSEVSNPKTTALLKKPPKKYVKSSNLMIMPVKFTFVNKKSDYINHIANLKPLVSSTNLELFSSLDSRIANEIYEIGPKILPQPFSQEFLNLANHKFLPLSILTKKLEFQLSKGQVTNYNIKQSHPAKCPNRPNSQGGLGLFRVVPLKKRPTTKLNYSPTNKNNKHPDNNTNNDNNNNKPELDVKNDRYYSRLNIYELSKILDLHRYSIGLTKLIELNVLEMFGNYCDFQLGYQTWIRDTDKEKRRALIQQLYSYTSTFYPEIDSFKLEVIIRRGSYSLMQTRLRRERRLKKKIK